ncbi:Peptidoglycan/LPS O-acetylase OafA/YrhL, contains acyltransferase and SGNH-hydrolase domains [Nonomuraea maritima]|uniref:Peptidoglycan/LPS O-acetylase OafA/YrhL, contains acyltransferase and SGNH-hydrolase domains n=1 Tax=Nonomuraea maritima TaxID=683260 RepID=A0A1G8WIU5_9ACTN|nr:acyltransferase [Nonomuraea maritima]SDJ77480.1 Peptidoglycan/LPS O-acetylase OafA/YrhL, contains acyltransferase and SGNH-hydrolase domains [Nonomuraea maritima]
MSSAARPPVPSPVSTSRLAWLDALRGIGAMAVVVEHTLPWYLPSLRFYWFNPGVYGILVFFLVSGYIIPASLERRGDVRAFWISRFFRLYPLYLAVIAVMLALAWWVPVREAVVRDGSAVAAHATMLLDVVSVGGIADTMWTLSYEMVFYLVVTALFLTRGHERSGTLAMAFAAAAVVVGLLSSGALLQGGWLAYASGVIFVCGLACVVWGRFRTVAAVVLGVMAVTLLAMGSRVPWLGLAIVAVMFAGTAIYRWERGTGPLWPVAVTAALVAAAPVWAIMNGWWWVRADVWVTTTALAGATFAGAMALRGRRLPKVVVWLGLISYSLYLVHHPVLKYVVAITGDLRSRELAYQLAMTGLALVVTMVLSALAYRYIEKPLQAMGRRLSRRLAAPPPRGSAAAGAAARCPGRDPGWGFARSRL